MRMDREQALSAYEVVNEYSKENLTKIFLKYGEDRFANNIVVYLQLWFAFCLLNFS